MEAHEIAEQIHEHSETHAHAAPAHDWFRRLAAIYIGVVAMLLAIATLLGAEATKEMLNANIKSSDSWAFYQAKSIRQTQNKIAAEQLELLAVVMPGLSPDHLAKVGGVAKRYRDDVARYESEPAKEAGKKGEGKKELMAQALALEHERDEEAAKLRNYEYAEALLQIAIVLGSVAIVAASPWLLGASGVLAVVGVLLTGYGYLLHIPLPHG